MKKQREKVLKTLESKLFVTPETREAIRQAAGNRSDERVEEIEQELEEMLDQVLKMTLTQRKLQGDLIIHTPERRIGKTEALIKTAAEWNIPIVAGVHERDYMRDQVMRKYNNEVVAIISINEAERALKGTQYSAILKTELAPTERVKEMLRKIGMEQITVVGFEEV